MPLPNKTVVFRLSSIGDIILSSPLLRGLRSAAGPAARIDFVVKKQYAELVKFNPHLSIVHEYDEATGLDGLHQLGEELRAEQYGLVVDIHNNLRTKYLRRRCEGAEIVQVSKQGLERWILVHLKKNIYKDNVPVAERYLSTVSRFDVVNDGKGLEIFIPDEIQFGVTSRMGSLRLHRYRKVIGICPGAKHFTKRWPQEKFAAIASRLSREFEAKIFIFGGVDDRQPGTEIAAVIAKETGEQSITNFAGTLRLLETAAAMEYCDLIITNDTGLMHLASARQKKILAIFGSTVKEFGFFPYGTESVVLERNDLSCRPCSHIGRNSCPEKHFRCMNDITAEDVYASAARFL
jgi:lipopolysaccharide heptosyltransferase II